LQPKFKSIPEAFVQAKKEETPGKEAALKAKTLDSQILALQSVLDENENRFRREIEYFDSSRLSQSEDDTGIKSGSQAQAVDLRSSSELEFSDRFAFLEMCFKMGADDLTWLKECECQGKFC